MSERTRTTLVLAGVFTAYWFVTLGLDSRTDLGQQMALGLTTWLFLGAALRLSPPRERVKVLTMVGVATCFEGFSSLLVGFYRYRLENLPLYVPPGHGLFFLVASRLAEIPWLERHRRLAVGAVLAGSTLLVGRGLTLLPVADLFGLGAWIVFVSFLSSGRHSLFYAVSFSMTMALEFYGTGLGLWRWSPVAPLVGLPAGNPPSGIGAGYCVMDAVARRVAPYVEGALRDVRVPISCRRLIGPNGGPEPL